MHRLSPTQERVCQALATLGGRADANSIAAWIRRTRGYTVPPSDLRRELRDLVDRGVVRAVGVREVDDALPSDVYALTAGGASLGAAIVDGYSLPNELAQDAPPDR